MKFFSILFAALLTVAGICGSAGEVLSAETFSKGQTLYLPLYSHVYFGDREREFNLAATAYVRNTDLERAITLLAADYYSNQGQHLKSFVEKPVKIEPLASVNFIVKESDTTGGSGATVVVRWTSTQPVNPPVVEAVMIGTASTQGISFVCQGRVITEE
jgi:hypothetical protein